MQKKRPVITEAKLRRIIRDELARQYLVQEGFLDSIKNPFKKLGQKAKKAIIEKSDEVFEKIKKIIKTLEADSLKKFLSSFKQQEGSVPLKELVATVGIGNAFKKLKDASDVDMSKFSKANPVKESFDVHDFHMSMILIEEEHNQKYGGEILNESVILAASAFASAWWFTTKSFVGLCGGISLVLKVIASICKFTGLDDLAQFLIDTEHVVEEVEKAVLERVLFPKPVQYAAYRALHLGKSKLSKDKGEESHEALSYEEFFSEQGKEERELATNGIKFAVIAAALLQTIPHILENAHEFLTSLKNSAHETTHAAKNLAGAASHAGKEGVEALGTAAKISKAAEEIGPSAAKAVKAARG